MRRAKSASVGRPRHAAPSAICKPEELARIEVTNLDRWVVRFLRGRGYQFRILFGRDRDAWQQALDLKPRTRTFPTASTTTSGSRSCRPTP